MATERPRCLTIDDINQNIKIMEYAIYGPVPMRAGEIKKELEQGVKKPFTRVINANIGDCQAMGQVPITFMRQVMSLVTYPPLLDDPSMPDDAKSRAREILKGCVGNSIGSYTHPIGIEIIRKHAAQYIERRDGIPSDWENIVLTEGATGGIKNLIKMLNCDVNGKKPGIMVPIPLFPLYSAILEEFGMPQIDYYLDEATNWGLKMAELQRAIDEAKKVCLPRGIVVINPGNPTGQVLTRDNIEEIIKFSYENRLFIFADEVYQENIYDETCKFHSFKRVMADLGKPYSTVELASFVSCSKGYTGECGVRGGYAEVLNMCPEVKAMYFKAVGTHLCPNVMGQTALDVIVYPPKPGEPSYDLFMQEKTNVLNSLKERSKMVVKAFNSFEGFRCNPVQGAMYAFPQIILSPKALAAAKKANQVPDVYYAFQLLESTGICVVPGSGFGQQPGTFHFRTTILPQKPVLADMLEKFRTFHENFCLHGGFSCDCGHKVCECVP